MTASWKGQMVAIIGRAGFSGAESFHLNYEFVTILFFKSEKLNSYPDEGSTADGKHSVFAMVKLAVQER